MCAPANFVETEESRTGSERLSPARVKVEKKGEKAKSKIGNPSEKNIDDVRRAVCASVFPFHVKKWKKYIYIHACGHWRLSQGISEAGMYGRVREKVRHETENR